MKEVTIVHHKQKYIGTAAKGFIELLTIYVNKNRLNEGKIAQQNGQLNLN
jgi:hypothetical protein